MSEEAIEHEQRARRAWQIGGIAGRSGLWEQAVEQFRLARSLSPREPLYATALAQAWFRLEDADAGLEALTSACELAPGDSLLLVARAQCLEQLQRHKELVDLLDAYPRHELTAQLLEMLGQAQVKLGLMQSAAETWLALLVRTPSVPRLHLNLGHALHALSLASAAAECLRTGLALGLDANEAAYAQDLLLFLDRQACDWRPEVRPFDALRESVRQLPDEAVQLRNPFTFIAVSGDPYLNLRAAQVQSRHIEQGVPVLAPRAPVKRARLRIGYVSSDFHQHATSMLLTDLLEHHDRARFEVFLYSHGSDDGSVASRRVRQAGEHFVDLHGTKVPDMIRRVWTDEIDILVDLKGHTRDNRLELFAARPAPVQVSYLGFPGSSGARFLDYVVGDPWVTPLVHADRYTERIAQLPSCYQCNDGRRHRPRATSRSLHGLPEQALVLCGFNQPFKISPEVFDSWCRILRALPQALLWLLEWNPEMRGALIREAIARGVEASRLVFAPIAPIELHLDRIGCADLFLDTWPYNAHTTASEALWSGLPVATYSGETFASRVAGSLLHALDLSELVADSVSSYERLVVELGRDSGRRAALRTHLLTARDGSALFDGRRQARALESLFQRMWQRALAGLPPDHLPACVD